MKFRGFVNNSVHYKFQMSSSKNFQVVYDGTFFSAGIRAWLDLVRNFKLVITRSFPSKLASKSAHMVDRIKITYIE